MPPIPIVSLIDAVTFFFSLAVTARLYRSYKKSRNIYIQYFFYCFASVSIAFFLLASPGILVSHVFVLAVFSAFATFSGIIGTVFFTLIPITLRKIKKIKYAYIGSAVSIAIIGLILELVSLEPFRVVERELFVYWLPESSPLNNAGRMLSGLALIVSLGIAGVSFLLYGIRNQTTYRIRALLLGVSALLFGMTAAVNFVIGAQPTPEAFLGAAILALIAVILLTAGVYYKPETTEWSEVKKK